MRRLASLGVLGAVLGLFAGLFDAEVLWVPAIGLVALSAGLTGGLLLAARGAQVQRELGSGRVIEDEPLGVRLRVRAGVLPLAAGELGGDDGIPTVRLPAGRRRLESRSEIRFPRRGRRGLAPPELRLADPLGLGRRVVRGGSGDEVLVLPRIEPVRPVEGGSLLTGGEDTQAGGLGAESELDGLRPYRPGAPATRIHWPALARGAGLVERRLLPDADRLPLIALDPSAPADDADLDAAVRAAASLAVALARAGGCAVLLPGDRRATALDETLAAWPGLHARLALVEDGPPPTLAGLGHRHRTLVYVAARRPTRLPAALALGPRAGRILVLPGGHGPGTAMFEVAGCRGYAVGAVVSREAA
jgi:uncharacterized protein (DUF58 family)